MPLNWSTYYNPNWNLKFFPVWCCPKMVVQTITWPFCMSNVTPSTCLSAPSQSYINPNLGGLFRGFFFCGGGGGGGGGGAWGGGRG